MALKPRRQISKKDGPRKPWLTKGAEKPSRSGATQQDVDKYFGSKSLWRIEQQLKAGRYISPDELASAIEANPRERLSNAVRTYVCLVLRGKIKKKRGRKPQPFSMSDDLFYLAVSLAYEEKLREFQKEHKAAGRQRGDWAPHERAIASIKARFKPFANITPERLANILSSRRNPSKFP